MGEAQPDQKKVIVFVGETTDAQKAKFQQAVKEHGAAEVEFVDVPQDPLTKSAAHPHVEKASECAEKMYDVYKHWFPTFHALFVKHISDISWKNEPPFKAKVIHHLCDRIIHVPIYTATMHKENPMYSYIDCASLNRSLFETIVNCLYILTDKSNGALAGLISKSVDEDVNLKADLLKWTSHANPGIAEGAKIQASFITTQPADKNKLLLGFAKNPPAFPNIRTRCDSLGDIWQFLYVSRYKQMCAWSHIHLEHVMYSPSQTVSSPEDLARAVSKGTEMVYLSFHLVYLFFPSLTDGNRAAQDGLTATYQSLLTDLEPILKESRQLTPTAGTA